MATAPLFCDILFFTLPDDIAPPRYNIKYTNIYLEYETIPEQHRVIGLCTLMPIHRYETV
jgi:hypothetical protein